MHGTPRLYIFSGLSGSGKSTLAQFLARELRCAYVRIDTIEQCLRDLCEVKVQAEGYRLAYRVVADNLRVGLDVVADSCNPMELTRREWEQVAREAGAAFVNIQTVCSDPVVHRRRVESRKSTVPGLILPAWEDVMRRHYEPWKGNCVTVDTACTLSECQSELISALWHLQEENEEDWLTLRGAAPVSERSA